MNILQIVDSKGWAIDRLSRLIVRYNPQFNWRTIYVHPREVEAHVAEVKDSLAWADVVDLQYWNTARQLLDLIPELHQKKTILSHHNQKDLLSASWESITSHVAHTELSGQKLAAEGYPNVHIIPYGIDLDFFRYNDKYDPAGRTVGYCGRITPWKGLKELARACFELDYRLLFMGKMDKRDYWESIPEEHRAHIDFSYMEAGDEDRVKFYHELTIYAGNSNDGREEGTQGLLEAMACGVPVLTTPAGMAADIIDDRQNGWITPYGDYEALKENLQELMDDAAVREDIRKKAWQTIKIFTEERMAWEFSKVIYKTASELPLVSVVVPVYNGVENVVKILNALELSLKFYENIEVVICDDGSDDGLHGRINNFREVYPFPIKYVFTSKDMEMEDYKPYGLAEARNLGVVEAAGDYIVFCDSRMAPDPDAVSVFMKNIQAAGKAKVWLFGEKGGKKNSFVENFSCIRRDYFIRAGMMNERIDHYGGMSQELRTRFQWQGFELQYVPEANAVQLSGSHMTDKRRQDIIRAKLLLWKMGMKG